MQQCVGYSVVRTCECADVYNRIANLYGYGRYMFEEALCDTSGTQEPEE